MIKKFIHAILERLFPYRTACFSIMIAIFSIILVSVISAVGTELIDTELESLGLDSIALGLADTKSNATLDSAVYDTLKTIPGISASTPVIMDTGTFQLGRISEENTLFWGISGGAEKIIALNVLYGRMFLPEELLHAEKVCLVDEALAMSAYQRRNITDKQITLTVNGISDRYRIVGVLKAGSSLLNSITGTILPNFVYVPYTTLSFFSAKNGYDQIIIKADQSADITTLKEQIFSKMSKSENLDAKKTLKLNDLFGQRQTVVSIVRIASAVMLLIACVALLVSGVAVMSSVGTAVTVRRKEIGIKKSLGASIIKILFEFLQDILLGTFISVALGILLGSVFLFFLLQFLHLNYTCNLNLLFFGVALMVTIAVLFGFFPAFRAARMKPLDALREE